MKFLILLVLIQTCWCLSEENNSNPPPKSALDFMKQYGYLKAEKTSAALYTEDGLSEVIKTVQRFGALNETGKLDNATLKLIKSPRCGNADIIHGKRSKRFVLTSGWNKRHITYYVANWSPRLGEQVVAQLIGKALNTWGSYGNLKFSRANTPDADIIVSFARGAHNDPFPFDGPGYVLAHAYFPNSGSAISGDIHFDDDENWVHGSSQAVEDGGTDFYSVALHELGHSLGLAHSNDPRSVMFPYYQGGDETSLHLGQDDIMAMYQLYIARTIEETTVTTTETTRRTRPPNTRPTNETPRTRPTNEPRYPFETSRTRAPDEFPKTRAPDDPRKTTYRESTRTWESSTSSIRTFAPTYKSSRRDETYPTFSTPSTFYPTHKRRNEGETTISRWYTTNSKHWKDHTNKVESFTMKSNNRFPSTSTDVTTRKYITSIGTSGTMDNYYPPTTDSQSSTPPKKPNVCEGKFDSVAYLRGEIFIFKNEYIWRLHDRNRIVSGYPVLLRHMFPHLPENIKKIDAAYQRPDGNMILFTGDHYWVYDGSKFIENSPKPILDYGIPLGIGGIDAVQTWNRNGMTYLFKQDRFWRYNETNKKPDEGYPQHISKWRGIPRNIDAAMTWKDGNTYFFKDHLYWTLDNHRVEATSDSPRFATEWLRCP